MQIIKNDVKTVKKKQNKEKQSHKENIGYSGSSIRLKPDPPIG